MKKLSLDNGANWLETEEEIRNYFKESSIYLDTIINYMDDETREAVSMAETENDIDFIIQYLKIADENLIIG